VHYALIKAIFLNIEKVRELKKGGQQEKETAF
jgi:hypothetical protein